VLISRPTGPLFFAVDGGGIAGRPEIDQSVKKNMWSPVGSVRVPQPQNEALVGRCGRGREHLYVDVD
jgi:hypothetical protein